MTKLDKMKIEAELASVKAGKLNLLCRIQEFVEEIARHEGHVKIQEEKESELLEKLKNFSE